MRTSRVSRDTSKLFERVSSPPRRSTRSLARFSYADTTPDIEDGPPTKRRKATTVKTELKDDAAPATIKSEPVEDTAGAPKARRARKPARKTTDSNGETTTAPPSDWEDMYDAVKGMRAPGGRAYGAAVDTMGCERLADKSASPREQRFHTLVALMLSSQTKDTVNAVAMQRLKTELPAYKEGAPMGLNLENMLAVDADLLNQLIWAVGFHNNKTKLVVHPVIYNADELGISSKRPSSSETYGRATSPIPSKA